LLPTAAHDASLAATCVSDAQPASDAQVAIDAATANVRKTGKTVLRDRALLRLKKIAFT
jgi:hypothetical protein